MRKFIAVASLGLAALTGCELDGSDPSTGGCALVRTAVAERWEDVDYVGGRHFDDGQGGRWFIGNEHDPVTGRGITIYSPAEDGCWND